MVANYVIHILDMSGDVAGVLDSVAFSTLRYERVLNGIGAAQFTVKLNDDRADLISKDTLFEVFRYADDNRYMEGTFITRFIEQAEDDGIDWMIVAGFSLEYLLGQRYILPENDPLGANGFSTKQDPADTMMVELVNEQAGAGAGAIEQVPSLTEQVAAGTGTVVGGRWSRENLLESLQNLTQHGEIDFYIERTSAINLLFVAEQVGTDKTRSTNYPGGEVILFNPELGNMSDPDFTQDWREEKTVVLLAGQGSEGNRDTFQLLSGVEAQTPYSYALIVIDARQVADGDSIQYITQAQDALIKNQEKSSFGFSIDRTEDTYRDVWDLGDKVTAEWGDISEDLRIISVSVDVGESGVTVSPGMKLL